MDQQLLSKLAKRIRRDILTASSLAGSGHPTSSLSATDLMTMLFFEYLRFDLKNPSHSGNDRVIFSKGHATPLYYSLFAAAGAISPQELSGYRTLKSPLEGHPTPRFPFTEAATGSLGQGLGIGAGEALAIKRMHNAQLPMTNDQELKLTLPKVYVLLGDGELAEGSVWEAAQFASYYQLDNLIAIADINGLGQSDPTMYDYDIELFQRRFEAFGWGVMVVDGHNFSEIDAAYKKALAFRAGPSLILAKTVKGKGVSFLEGKPGWHGKTLSKDECDKALQELGEVENILGKIHLPQTSTHTRSTPPKSSPKPLSYTAPTATRKAFGEALLNEALVDPTILVMDGDVKNSTFTEFVANKLPGQFVECFIAEQTMVGVATGAWKRGLKPVVSTFAAFLTRAFDQIRMASVSQASILFNGSHAGVSIGADGSSQMGLEDIAMFRAILGSTVMYPSDPYQTATLIRELLKTSGIRYIRTTREALPILYKADDAFSIGGSRVHNSKNKETVTVIAAGITLHEALKAQQELGSDRVGIRVIDCYSVKPIDTETLKIAVHETKALIVVEDHYPEGGIFEAVTHALATDCTVPIYSLAVTKPPHSGKPEELLRLEEIDTEAIIKKVKEVSI